MKRDWGERAEGTATRTPVLSHSPTPQTTPFVGGALPSIWHEPRRTQELHPLVFKLPDPVGACALLRSQLSGPEGRGLGRLMGCSYLSGVALGWGPFLTLSPETDWCLPVTGHLLAPLSQLLVAPPSSLLVTLSCETWAEFRTD